MDSPFWLVNESLIHEARLDISVGDHTFSLTKQPALQI